MLSVTLYLTPTTIKVNRILRHGSRKWGRRFQRIILPLSMGKDPTLMGISSVHFSSRRWECTWSPWSLWPVVVPCMSPCSTQRFQRLRRRTTYPLLCKIKDDLYTVLDIKKGASAKEIKRAYRRMAIRLHPDVNPGPELRAKFEKVLQAYKVLGDENRRAMYDKDLGKESRGWGYVNPNTRVHYDQVERKGEAWRKSNPTAETVIDDSFGRILGDFFSGIGTLGRSGFGGGRDLLESIVELMESKAVDTFMESEGTNFEDVLSVGGREEIRQAAKDVKLFSRKLKCKVVEVGETTLATEKELDELRQKMKAGMKQGRIDGLSWSISDVEREIELVEKCAGLRARYKSLKKYLKSVEQFQSRLETKIQQIMNNSSPPVGEQQQFGSQKR
eukprot:553112_1